MAGQDAQLEQAGRVKPGTYSDGHPLDTVHYLESKLILKPDRFVAPLPYISRFRQTRASRRREARYRFFDCRGSKGLRPRIREVVFLDTKDFSLYNNSFILRRRITYKDGFPVGQPGNRLQVSPSRSSAAAEMDVRPNIPGDYEVKFKTEALPLKDKLGGCSLTLFAQRSIRIAARDA